MVAVVVFDVKQISVHRLLSFKYANMALLCWMNWSRMIVTHCVSGQQQTHVYRTLKPD